MTLNTILIMIFSFGNAERIFSMVFRQREKEGIVQNTWTTYLLVATYSFCILFILIEFLFLKVKIAYFITFLGAVIEVVGITLRMYSIRTVGDYWSIHIRTIIGQPLTKSGPYKLIRHPYYIAVIFELLGWALFLNTFFAIYIIILLHLPILLYRINLEEKNLLRSFGSEYKNYMLVVNRFFPRLPS